MKSFSLIIAGLIFTLVTALHILRFYKGWEVVIVHQTIPVQWSIYGAIISGVLALWMFIAASFK